MRRRQPATVLVLDGAVCRGDVERLCSRIRSLVADGDVTAVICDVRGLAAVDLATVDTLARVQLLTRRLGAEIRLRQPPPPLRQLLDLLALSDALPIEPP